MLIFIYLLKVFSTRIRFSVEFGVRGREMDLSLEGLDIPALEVFCKLAKNTIRTVMIIFHILGFFFKSVTA